MFEYSWDFEQVDCAVHGLEVASDIEMLTLGVFDQCQ
jgi:hypothetical protein